MDKNFKELEMLNIKIISIANENEELKNEKKKGLEKIEEVNFNNTL